MRMGYFLAVGVVDIICSLDARNKSAHIGPGKLRRQGGKKPASGRDDPSGAQIDLYGRFFCLGLRHER